jgi:hypothetical protein
MPVPEHLAGQVARDLVDVDAMRPSARVLIVMGSTLESSSAHWRLQQDRTASRPRIRPPSQPLGQSTSSLMPASAVSRSRALKDGLDDSPS